MIHDKYVNEYTHHIIVANKQTRHLDMLQARFNTMLCSRHACVKHSHERQHSSAAAYIAAFCHGQALTCIRKQKSAASIPSTAA